MHDNHGQRWTANPEYASGNEEIKRALLPQSVKRLVIVDPHTGEYNWEHVAELEKLINEPSLAKKLRNNMTLVDLWKSEWTNRLQQSGYDSIAIKGPDGPEEYVLDPSKLILLHETATNRKE